MRLRQRRRGKKKGTTVPFRADFFFRRCFLAPVHILPFAGTSIWFEVWTRERRDERKGRALNGIKTRGSFGGNTPLGGPSATLLFFRHMFGATFALTKVCVR